MIHCVSNSYEELLAIPKKRIKSLDELFHAPLAIFEDMEIHAVLICDTKPNFSSLEKSLVIS